MVRAVICVFLASLLQLSAQECPTQKFSHQIGASLSMISGFGLSYQYVISDKYRVKVTGFYVIDNGSSNEIINSLGIEGQKKIFQTEIIRVYGLFGIGMYQIVNDYNLENYTSKDITYTGGGGCGISFLASERISFNFDVGLMYSFNESKHYAITGNAPLPISPAYRSKVSFGVGGGLGFGFQL